ncbi:DNA recombination protein RmuC [Thaumasiovibrio subtropicus]|uniref:DNA recombination protein RmuC n=1 Tax=Thaumasiovibrio subtropicus TaxID=1891207 RepID=UPI000B354543|nr:DNA recombination protein RmuC [Thaumasiovibrio subtropicus]
MIAITAESLVLAASCSTLASAIVAWFISGRAKQREALMQQQLDAQQTLSEAKLTQLQTQLEARQHDLDEMDVTCDRLNNEARQMHARLASAAEKLRQFDAIQQEKQYYREQLENARGANAGLEGDLRELEARHSEERKALQEKVVLLENAEQRLREQFETLANQLFEKKSRSVDEQNRLSLEGLLGPLKSQLEGFRQQMDDNFGREARERHTLIHEIHHLKKLNEQMAQEAINLTQALKGDNKAQGNWGEVVLARVLESCGLREGHEYHTQVSLENEQGKRYQPDVIVDLPKDKQVVVDAKMSLVAYERYFNADTLAEQELALSEHITSVRSHIRGLSRKDYQELEGIRSLDYVLLFIPVEPAFQVAVAAEPHLVKEAMEHNIMLVSPTTLMVALRTIANLWRYENQNHNAKLIAERAAKLYDKLRLFVNDMEQVGQSLDKATQGYRGAMNKLVVGRGNVIRQAESFKTLGVEVKRDISPQLVANLTPDDELPELQNHTDQS